MKIILTTLLLCLLTGCASWQPLVRTVEVDKPVPVQPVQPPVFSLPHLIISDIAQSDTEDVVVKKYEATITQLKSEVTARDKALDVYRTQPQLKDTKDSK